MPEYIDREKMIADLEEEIEHDSPMYTREQNQFLEKGLRIALKDVKYMKSEDVVPVVRCKNCERRSKGADLNDTIYCPYLKLTMPKDAFCSYGERKENNNA